MIVESANPAHSLADSQRMREALERLDLLVVLDIAMTETARLADYVLPVAVPVREVGGELLLPRVPGERLPAAAAGARRRRPACSPRPRSTRGSCARSARSTTSTSTACARRPSASRGEFAGHAVRRWSASDPELRRLAAGDRPRDARPRRCRTAPRAAAVLWLQAHGVAQLMPDSVRRAGFEGEGLELGEALFEAILAQRVRRRLHRRRATTRRWRRIANTDRQGATSRSPSCSKS